MKERIKDLLMWFILGIVAGLLIWLLFLGGFKLVLIFAVGAALLSAILWAEWRFLTKYL